MTVEEHALVKETEDQKALRALLARDMDSAPPIDSIPVPPSETDALQQDVADFPDVSTIDEYARMPTPHWGCYVPQLGGRRGCYKLGKSEN